jgi:beta-glucosidase
MPKTVLIVEDESNIRELLRMYLDQEGYITEMAQNGAEGLRVFKRVHPDLVLLDKTMKYVVEPGQFDIYVSASSSDDRLHAVISVTDENGKEVLPESYPDDVSVNRTSRFPAKIGVSENVTVPLLAGKSIDKLTVSWDKGTDCVFEILTTSGGGQFLPVYRGEVSTAGTQQYSFERLNAREIRVAVVKGVAVIKSIENKEVLAQ